MYIADMHCDTILKLWEAKKRGDAYSLRDTKGSSQELQIDLLKMKEGGALLQNFALFIDLKLPKNFDGKKADFSLLKLNNPNECMDPWLHFAEMAEIFHSEIAANSDLIAEARSYSDIEKNTKAGLMSAVLTLEEGGVLQGKIERLEPLYNAGVRMITLTWNYDNELGCTSRPEELKVQGFSDLYNCDASGRGGLKPFGFEAVREMERMGIIPDVSHLSDAGFYDVAKTVKGPFVASHSDARAVSPLYRNLSDDMIKIVADHGGVIGLNFCPSFIEQAESEDKCKATMEGIVRQVRHIINVGGISVLGIGTDFDGIPRGNMEIDDVSEMQKLPVGLEKAGFKDVEIEAVCYKNVLSLYKEVLK